MKRAKRSAPGEELLTQSQFVGQNGLLNMSSFMGKHDTFPELGPLNPLPPLSFEDPRERELSTLAETLEREVATNKMLEQKCEEYLSQLQRSADIIESSREKHEQEVDHILERLEDSDRRLHEERERRREAEEERERTRLELERFRGDTVGIEGERDAFRENLYRKEANIGELKVKIGELENEVSGLKAELTVTKSEKQRSDQEVSHFRKEVETMERELETKKHELQRLDYKEEGSKSQLSQVQERLNELRTENSLLRQDKDKLFTKVDHLLYENDNLRNEVFMLKKILFEVEKREMGHSQQNNYSNQQLQFERPKEQRRIDPEIEMMRNRMDRPSRSPIGLARENLGIRENASRFEYHDSQQDMQQGNNSRIQGNNNAQSDSRSSTRQSGMFNKSSSGTSDIITWDNRVDPAPQVGHSSNQSRPQTGGKMDPRDRKLVEEQLTELDLQVEKANIELNSVLAQQPKTGVTMKKKRELEDRLEVLEKQRAGLRSRLRMGLQNR
jgi:hypothetical protein